MKNVVKKYNPGPLLRLMKESVERCRLDLSGRTVLTEAASGAYVVTPVLAAMANSKKVYALTKPSPYGSVEEIEAETFALADLAGVGDRIEIITGKDRNIVGRADIITNSGHVRPIDAKMIGWMKPDAVIPLMYESWEFRPADLDLRSCLRRRIPVAGTNEKHPSLDVFSFLGLLAVKLLFDAGISVYGRRILLLCDNPFALFIKKGLKNSGARVDHLPKMPRTAILHRYDAILTALTPGNKPVIKEQALNALNTHCPGAIVVQFWGDIDREALMARGIRFWPLKAPKPGHMGVFMSDIGPEPVVRLQAGGLKVGQIMAEARKKNGRPGDYRVAVNAAVRSGFGQALEAGEEL